MTTSNSSVTKAALLLPFDIVREPSESRTAVVMVLGNKNMLGGAVPTMTVVRTPVRLEAGATIGPGSDFIEDFVLQTYESLEPVPAVKFMVWNATVPFPEPRGWVGVLVTRPFNYDGKEWIAVRASRNAYLEMLAQGLSRAFNRAINDYQAGNQADFTETVNFGGEGRYAFRKPLCDFRTAIEPGFAEWRTDWNEE